MDKTERMTEDPIPPDWVKQYLYVTKHSKISHRWLGCKNSKGEYKEVCFSSSKFWFRIKVFFFKITHPNWQFK
jgi:hypothetical protein